MPAPDDGLGGITVTQERATTMFIKLDDDTILDMATGTCYRYSPAVPGKAESEVAITFNGPQRDKFCGGIYADGLWTWLTSQAFMGEKGVTNASTR